MKLQQLVEEQGAAKFGTLLKVALDYARLLEDDFLQIDDNPETRTRTAQMRQVMFEEFCAVFSAAGLPIPALETDLLLALQPAADDVMVAEARSTAQLLRQRMLQATRRDPDLEVMADALVLMPWLLKDFGAPRFDLRSMTNIMLYRAGLDPIRPDYSKIRFGNATKESAPKRPLHILIVDNDQADIVRTARALMGWPNVKTHTMQQSSGSELVPDVLLAAAAREIIARSPDIVIMDQGLDRITGSDLIKLVIQKQRSDQHIIFVGNSGGDAEALLCAGALVNLNKGHNLEPLRLAITQF